MPGSIKESARTSSLPSRVAAPFLCAVGASRPLHSHHCDGRLWARIIRSVAHLVLRLAALGDLATRGRTSCEHWGKNLGFVPIAHGVHEGHRQESLVLRVFWSERRDLNPDPQSPERSLTHADDSTT